ncbi:hypothetical protein SUGI_0865750 [Cryptomeria japonica]|nr:hypothetical protein SUGI_0865750 [Cryptomeria japonica]
MPYWAFLIFLCRHETQDSARVHITDARKKRWEVLYDLLPRSFVAALEQAIFSKQLTQSQIPWRGSYPLYAVQQFTDIIGHTAAMPSWASGNELIFSYTTCYQAQVPWRGDRCFIYWLTYSCNALLGFWHEKQDPALS